MDRFPVLSDASCLISILLFAAFILAVTLGQALDIANEALEPQGERV